jgi:chromosome segregation ATPase
MSNKTATALNMFQLHIDSLNLSQEEIKKLRDENDELKKKYEKLKEDMISQIHSTEEYSKVKEAEEDFDKGEIKKLKESNDVNLKSVIKLTQTLGKSEGDMIKMVSEINELKEENDALKMNTGLTDAAKEVALNYLEEIEKLKKMNDNKNKYHKNKCKEVKELKEKIISLKNINDELDDKVMLLSTNSHFPKEVQDLTEENEKLKEHSKILKHDRYTCDSCKASFTGCENPICKDCVRSGLVFDKKEILEIK